MTTKLKAILLVAGEGTRLRPLTYLMPKCLVHVGDKPLLWYSVKNLLDVGVGEFCFVVGFKAQKIQDFVNSYFPNLKATFIFNKKYHTTNDLYSYYLAIPFLLGQNSFRIIGDLFYSRSILVGLLQSHKPFIAAVEEKRKPNPKDYLVAIDKTTGTISQYTNVVPSSHRQTLALAEGLEYIRADFSTQMARTVRKLVRNRHSGEYTESAYQNLINQGHLLYYRQLTKRDFWLEIDTLADLRLAKTHAI